MPASRGLLDTSIFIATETGRAIEEGSLPERAAISVVTLAELHVGVLAALDTATRARRLATLEATAGIEALPVDEDVAAAWARLRVGLADAGLRSNVNDLWIAATALVHGVPVVTQDSGFESIATLGEVAVIRV